MAYPAICLFFFAFCFLKSLHAIPEPFWFMQHLRQHYIIVNRHPGQRDERHDGAWLHQHHHGGVHGGMQTDGGGGETERSTSMFSHQGVVLLGEDKKV